MTRMLRTANWVVSMLAVIAGFAIALMMVHISVDVALRYTTGAGLPGTLTIVSYYYMVMVAFIPLAYAEIKGAHIQMEILTDLLPNSGRIWVRGWLLLPTAITTGVLAWRGFDEALKQFSAGAIRIQGSTSIPIWPSYFALPIGVGMMTLIVLIKFICFLSDRPSFQNNGRFND